eukprot:5586294-Prymnesium_polylepis.3
MTGDCGALGKERGAARPRRGKSVRECAEYATHRVVRIVCGHKECKHPVERVRGVPTNVVTVTEDEHIVVLDVVILRDDAAKVGYRFRGARAGIALWMALYDDESEPAERTGAEHGRVEVRHR